MSTGWKIVSIVTLAVVVLTAAAVVMTKQPVAYAQGAQAAATTTAPSGISVVGQGKVTAKPDVAYVTVGVQTMAPTAKEAMDQNNTTMAAIVAALKDLGIAAKDMQTGSINLYPQMQQPKPDGSGANEISGYSANNSLNVTVNDLTKVGAVLDTAVAAGANTVGGIRFDVKDPSALEDQALQAAVKDAQSTANLVAGGLGLKVSGVQNVTVNSTNVPGPIYYDVAASAPKGMGGASVPVEAGELTFTASVNVTFGF